MTARFFYYDPKTFMLGLDKVGMSEFVVQLKKAPMYKDQKPYVFNSISNKGNFYLWNEKEKCEHEKKVLFDALKDLGNKDTKKRKM